ncbi:MSMEG_0568 family radical SAM protein [Pseudokineococcus sp. 1T1Z-3]|uniref:MSMEG_0568 family radical SAM protein n=1 Tax=Pseudokineococcus sp. 1T1Z-3 TaxID=3132745 RepID=UPI0030ADA501
MTLSTRVDVAIRGVRTAAPLQRRGGAGPSDDGHLRLDGRGAALPLDPSSPYLVRDGRLWREDGCGAGPTTGPEGAGLPEPVLTDTGVEVEEVARPAFYDLRTASGVPYEHLARVHGDGVLATTVVQTCIRYAQDQRCRFCSIEESLRAGLTTAVKRPEELAEVAEAAVRLDGVRQLVMTTGTSAGRDRGARHVARCVRAVKAAVPDLPVQVQVEPPEDLSALAELRAAGADSLGVHVESLDDDVRRAWMPGKATVSLDRYRAAWAEGVRLFGRNQVSTYLLVGLGEDPDELVAGAAELAASGVYPFVVPFRPMAGTLAVEVDGARAPDPAVLADVTARVAADLVARGMRGADQRAGCAACGGCSALAEAGA